MLNPRTATTTTKVLHRRAGPGAPLADDQPRYAYAGHGAFLPANAAAVKECDDWNRYAAMITSRSAARRSEQ